MHTRRVIVLLLVVGMVMTFCGCGFAATGEGYFGDEDLEESSVPELERDSVPAPATKSARKAPKRKPNNNEYNYKPPVFPYDDMDEGHVPTESRASRKKNAPKLERYSEDTEKVLRSYGIDDETFYRLLDRHNDAANGPGNQEKFDRYEIIFNEYPYDYLAAYRAAQANMGMDRKGQAQGWLERALKINPHYIPAKQLLKRARAR